jgi:DNA-binding transcriptional LysR family regulator
MSLTFRQMEVIRAVSRHGSVTMAASALDISQPAVSMMLRECTRAAGFPLFQRHQGRLRPTAETRGLLDEVERVFDGVERINRLLHDMRETQTGTIRIAATPTLADNLLPYAIQRFQQARPRIQLTVETMDNLRVVDGMTQDRFDLGLVLTPVSQPETRLIELCASELICVMPIGHPLASLEMVTPADIAAYPLISFARALPLGALVDRIFKEAELHRRIALEVNQSSVACALARAGVGVAIIDPFWLIDSRSHGIVSRKISPRATVSAQVLIPREAPLSRPTRMFLATLRRTVATLQAAGHL